MGKSSLGSKVTPIFSLSDQPLIDRVTLRHFLWHHESYMIHNTKPSWRRPFILPSASLRDLTFASCTPDPNVQAEWAFGDRAANARSTKADDGETEISSRFDRTGAPCSRRSCRARAGGTYQGAGHPKAHRPHSRDAGQGLQPRGDRQGALRRAASRSRPEPSDSTSAAPKSLPVAGRRRPWRSGRQRPDARRPRGIYRLRRRRPRGPPRTWARSQARSTSFGTTRLGRTMDRRRRRARIAQGSRFGRTKRTYEPRHAGRANQPSEVPVTAETRERAGELQRSDGWSRATEA